MQNTPPLGSNMDQTLSSTLGKSDRPEVDSATTPLSGSASTPTVPLYHVADILRRDHFNGVPMDGVLTPGDPSVMAELIAGTEGQPGRETLEILRAAQRSVAHVIRHKLYDVCVRHGWSLDDLIDGAAYAFDAHYGDKAKRLTDAQATLLDEFVDKSGLGLDCRDLAFLAVHCGNIPNTYDPSQVDRAALKAVFADPYGTLAKLI
ncbi:hypothetical protein KIPB_003661 [Kipferlia bialata]|uniref:Uncharacterized protein n=1 Tax=Kipferlia bialata TaxID=797122 RepID=A0A9K3CU19_9EUKA|nr:hypothetical protein KIPB_003661 [Kipferlia bialata]|eukprot:g3661.t1